jgi:hypothetical protein
VVGGGGFPYKEKEGGIVHGDVVRFTSLVTFLSDKADINRRGITIRTGIARINYLYRLAKA